RLEVDVDLVRPDVLQVDAVRVSGGVGERERCGRSDSGDAHAQAGSFADRVVFHYGSPWLAEPVENSGSVRAIVVEDGRRAILRALRVGTGRGFSIAIVTRQCR